MDKLSTFKKSEESKSKRRKFYSIIMDSVSEAEYEFWFRDMNMGSFSENHFIFEVETELHKNWILTYYEDLFVDSLDKIAGTECTFEILVAGRISLIYETITEIQDQTNEIIKKIDSILNRL